RPMGGMITPSTSVETMRPNAAPMITATARSTTLPREMNSLYSFSIPVLLAAVCRRRSIPQAPAAGHVDNQPREQVQSRLDGSQTGVLRGVGVRAVPPQTEPLEHRRLRLERGERGIRSSAGRNPPDV